MCVVKCLCVVKCVEKNKKNAILLVQNSHLSSFVFDASSCGEYNNLKLLAICDHAD